MLELLSDIGLVFLMSSWINACIVIWWFKINNINISKKKYIVTILLLSGFHTIIQNIIQLLAPFLTIIYYPLIISIITRTKFLNNLWINTKLFIIMLLVEASIMMLLEYIFNVKLVKTESILLTLIYSIPVRIIEVLCVLFLSKRRNFICFGYYLENRQKRKM